MAAKQRETVPIEERIEKFKEMLAEKEVSSSNSHQHLCLITLSAGQRILHVGERASQNCFRSTLSVANL